MPEENKDPIELIPELDREFLSEKGYVFEVVSGKGPLFLIIKDFPFSTSYVPQIADLLIIIPAGYPNAPLDMFWTNPDVKLTNGNWPSASEHHEQYNGRSWQRWSRHGGWRMGIDSIKSFLASVKKEIAKGI